MITNWNPIAIIQRISSNNPILMRLDFHDMDNQLSMCSEKLQISLKRNDSTFRSNSFDTD